MRDYAGNTLALDFAVSAVSRRNIGTANSLELKGESP